MKIRYIFVILCAVVINGCPGEMTPPPIAPIAQQQSDSPEADGIFKEGVKQFEAGEYELAETQFARFEESFATDPLIDQVLLYRGRIALKRNNPQGAKTFFEQVYAKGDDTPLFEHAAMYMGLVMFQLSHFEETIAYLQPIAGRFTEQADNLAVLDTIWRAFAGLENWQQQLLWIEKYIDAGPADAEKSAALRSVRDVVAGQSETALSPVRKQLQKKGAVWTLISARIASVQLEEEHVDKAIAIVGDIKESGTDNAALVEDLIALVEARNRADMRTIGCLLPLTGKMRLVGQEVLNGVKLAADDHRFNGGQMLNVVTIDTAAWKKSPREAVAELVLKHRVFAIVGPMNTSFIRQAAQQAQNLGIPMIVLSTDETVSKTGSYIFQNFASNTREIDALVHTARENAIRRDDVSGRVRYLSLYPQNGYGKLMDRALKKRLQSDDVDVISISFPPDTKDFGKVATQLAAHDFSFLFLPMTSSQLALAAPAFAAADIWPSSPEQQSDAKVVSYLIPSVGYSQSLVNRSGRYLQGAHFVSSLVQDAASDVTAFVRDFQNKYKSRPSIYAGYGYDATKLLSNALIAGAASRSDVRTWLDEVVSVPSLVHPFDGFNALGESEALPPVLSLREATLQRDENE